MTTTVFDKIKENRKEWLPIKSLTPEYATSGAENTISRALTMRFLELPVREFINEGLNKSDVNVITEAGKECLLRNMEDEERHDIALNNCVSTYAQYDATQETVAKQLLQLWLDHPDHPILKACVLENGIFFVVLPIFRQWGGSSLRTTSVDISADEINHVQSHRYVANLLKQRVSKSLDDLRKATVAWIVENFAVENVDKQRFLTASDQLMYRGITDQLEFTQSYVNHAFFEKGNSKLPYYAQ